LPDVAGLARLAEWAGLDCLWAGDRLVAGQMPVLDASLVLAAAAAVTGRIAIGFSVYVPSLHPAGVARWLLASRRGSRRRASHGLPGSGLSDGRIPGPETNA